MLSRSAAGEVTAEAADRFSAALAALAGCSAVGLHRRGPRPVPPAAAAG